MRALALHLGVLAALFALQFALPAYHHTNAARIMVLAVYAMGYNIAFGYTGLLSLGHALFFAAGMYATGLLVDRGGWEAWAALPAGLLAGGAAAGLLGLLALRTTGPAFMIVTLMAAQAFHLSILYWGGFTGGDEGFTLSGAARIVGSFDLAQPATRYAAAFALFAAGMLVTLALVRSRLGRVLVAVRENEARTRMLGYDTFRARLAAMTLSGLFAGAAGAVYGLMFGYVGGSFASIQYSILPLIWVLLGGAGTVLGPLLGTALMFYLIDLSSSVTTAPQFVVGAALIGLVLFAPRGILGTLRERGWRLP
ncbi:branched-chain amino acid ABC transporter permease [Cereibacter sphaeroides]|uniref:branched-chain amino acid ABC transporter permease n=1 Tax=Cereibacter sphaeroides TaxID=1063 RepID=UPI001F1A07DA|nr:branched-chain amino acid ABC transporter permease [Cereibacter sphaeroides]MCE6952337.1 branched-chain amino acid ABC transporter permease [Cereibacter sphaeroides]